MPKTDKLNLLLDRLIKEGDLLIEKVSSNMIHDHEGVRRWSNDLILFCSLADDLILPWKARLSHNGFVIAPEAVRQPLSALKTIRAAIAEGLLTRYADLVIADTFADLTEQAEHLLSQGYFLASGVIFRAVLEERLRNMCVRNGVMPSKPRPTINDFNAALYSASPPIYDKSMMLHVTALAAIGNDAAHNAPTLKREDVDRLANSVRDFLARFST